MDGMKLSPSAPQGSVYLVSSFFFSSWPFFLFFVLRLFFWELTVFPPGLTFGLIFLGCHPNRGEGHDNNRVSSSSSWIFFQSFQSHDNNELSSSSSWFIFSKLAKLKAKMMKSSAPCHICFFSSWATKVKAAMTRSVVLLVVNFWPLSMVLNPWQQRVDLLSSQFLFHQTFNTKG
jgi:hypothetical protein